LQAQTLLITPQGLIVNDFVQELHKPTILIELAQTPARLLEN
jgi:hypothetical protein